MGTGLSGMEGGQSQFQLWTGGSLISFTISLSSRPLHTDMQPVQAATFFLNQPGSCLVEKVAQTWAHFVLTSRHLAAGGLAVIYG